MPDILAHCYCADHILDQLPANARVEEIRKRRHLVHLGAQGPDFFFYKDAWPWKDNGETYAIGSRLHKERVGAFFTAGMRWLLEAQDDSSGYYDALAYFLGWLTHYGADQVLHPFIYYYSGIPAHTSKKDGSAYDHKLMEMSLDTLLVAKTKAYANQKTVITAGVMNPAHLDLPGRMVAQVVKEVYGASVTGTIVLDSFRDMAQVLTLLHDPFMWKRKVIGLVERATGKPGAFSTATFPARLRPGVDYGNEAGATWYHPCLPDLAKTEGLFDLLDQATEKGLAYCTMALAVVASDQSLEAFSQVIGNFHYDTGLPIEDQAPMVVDASLFR